MPAVTVLNLRSLAYSGTTWVNLVLGSHPQALAIGPPQRAWTFGAAGARTACVVHRRRCRFWPAFLRTFDRRGGNFLVRLAEYSGRPVIVLNNPTPAFREQVLDHPEIDVRTIRVVRDGRANLASMMGHQPERYATVGEAARQWLRPALRAIASLPASQVALSIRYEDMVRDPRRELARVGALAGLEYPPNAIRYWEYEHHLADGNVGAVSLLRRLQGFRGSRHRRSDYYHELYGRTLRDPDVPVMDESWRSVLSRRDRLAYDLAVGDLHETLGYERDRFSADEVAAPGAAGEAVASR